MKHDVHIYALVRVKVPGVEADSHEEAIEKAEKDTDLNELFDPRRFALFPGIECVEWAEEIVEFLVDEEGDEEYERSVHWKPGRHGKLVKVFARDYDESDGQECGFCGEVSGDVQSTYCGSQCAECLAKHCEDCEVCAKDFGEPVTDEERSNGPKHR